MTIYRGTGGGGDATTDSQITALAAYATQAQTQAELATTAAGSATASAATASASAALAQALAGTAPSQTGNAGKYLTTNGTATSWATVDALPSQASNAGKYLTTDGTTPSWNTLNTDANTTTKGLYEMANVISTSYNITAGNNAISTGTITVNSGVTVTVPSGSTWAIV